MIEVYGANDDLVEVEGDLNEEFYYHDHEGEGRLLAFEDGTVLRIRYSESGVWRIVLVFKGSAYDRIVQAPEGDDDNYSDRAYLRPEGPMKPVRWVVYGSHFART